MSLAWPVLGVAAATGLLYIGLVAWRGVGIPPLTPGRADPAADPAEALDRLAALIALDGPDYADACATVLLEPDGEARGTFVFFHGFTNCPRQFSAVGDVLRDRGYRVLVTRQPRHGLRDRLNRSLLELTAEELIDHIDRAIDIAAGFDGPLYVVGHSGGGIQAAWAAVTRAEVQHVLVVSPAAAPASTPVSIVRLVVRFRKALPHLYIWWDPRTKTERVQSQYEYPGFPLPGIVPILHMAMNLGDGRVGAESGTERAILLSNPSDFAVSRPAARWMMANAFGADAADLREVAITRSLRWGHDFIDQASQHPATPEQAAEVFLASFGLTDDRTAGGLIGAGDRLAGKRLD